jgi:hypothetical protein
MPPVPWPSGPVPPGGLTNRWLDRALAIGDHLRLADATIRDAQRQPPGSGARDVHEWILGAILDTPLAARGHPRGRGRPPTDEARVLQVAVAYAEALRTDPHHVNQIVARRLKLPPERVPALVHQARNKCGFLTKTHQGVPGGQLTPLALARLSQRSSPKARITTTGTGAQRTTGRRRHQKQRRRT